MAWGNRIVVMIGYDHRPLIVFSDHDKAKQWLMENENMDRVLSVLVFTDGQPATEDVQDTPARFLSRITPPDGLHN